MKKILSLILVLMGFALIFAACTREGQEEVENTCPYALMHDGVTYYYTGEAIYEKIKITEDAILGRVTSVIPESSMPEVSGQANIDILGSIYIRGLSGDGLLVLIDGEWIIFENRDDNGNTAVTDSVMSPLMDSYTVGTADDFSAWEFGATYGYTENLGMDYWMVERTSDTPEISTTKILPSEDGERYIAFGLRKNRAKAGDFTEVKAFRVVSSDGKLVSVTETEPMTREVVLEKGVPYTGSLDGEYMCETRKGDDYDGHTMTHTISISGNKIISNSYVRATCGGGKYEGSYTYDKENGEVCAELSYTITDNDGEVTSTTHTIKGKLLSYGGFVHFVLLSSEPYIFSLTTEDPFPMSFKLQ